MFLAPAEYAHSLIGGSFAMAAANSNSEPVNASRVRFHSTAWSIVARAAGSDVHARAAFEDLCKRYWYPLYAFLRRQGQSAQDAEDSVQSFFVWMLESETIARADPLRGRFRTYLIAAFKQFLSRLRQYEGAAKRKPERPLLSIDGLDGQEKYRREPAIKITPDMQFEYAWAMSVIDRSLARLRTELEAAGKQKRFDAMKMCLTIADEAAYQKISDELQLSEGAVRVAVHRMRTRYGQILREEIAQTLDIGDDVNAELSQLLTALRIGQNS